jgi:predicted PurR-regulated permease PerM
MTETKPELARITLGVLFIGGLIAGSFWILRPFLPALVWAAMIVVATWPLMLQVERLCGGRRPWAVALMCLLLLAVLIVPLAVATEAILSNIDTLQSFLQRLPEMKLPPPPDWLAGLPLIGERASTAWANTSQMGFHDFATRIQPHVREIVAWFGHRAGSIATLVLHFLLIVILAAVLYSGGEAWASWMKKFGRRLAPEQGERMVVLAGQAIRGVALGVIVTALVQTILGGVGLAIVGVPFAPVLTAIMFALCIAQLGPLLVLLGATAWAFANLGSGWGTFMLVWALAVGLMDNFLRPVLIKRGADLPLLLIFAGVIGGLVSFGIVGIFVGPVVLAVAYTLTDEWVRKEPAAAEPAAAGAPTQATLSQQPGMAD